MCTFLILQKNCLEIGFKIQNKNLLHIYQHFVSQGLFVESVDYAN